MDLNPWLVSTRFRCSLGAGIARGLPSCWMKGGAFWCACAVTNFKSSKGVAANNKLHVQDLGKHQISIHRPSYISMPGLIRPPSCCLMNGAAVVSWLGLNFHLAKH